MSFKKYNITFIIVISILLALFFSYQYDNNHHQLIKSLFAIEDRKAISDNDILELIKQGDYNLDIIMDFYRSIEWYNKILAIDSKNV